MMTHSLTPFDRAPIISFGETFCILHLFFDNKLPTPNASHASLHVARNPMPMTLRLHRINNTPNAADSSPLPEVAAVEDDRMLRSTFSNMPDNKVMKSWNCAKIWATSSVDASYGVQ